MTYVPYTINGLRTLGRLVGDEPHPLDGSEVVELCAKLNGLPSMEARWAALDKLQANAEAEVTRQRGRAEEWKAASDRHRVEKEALAEEVGTLTRRLDEMAQALQIAKADKPVPMILHCPGCAARHVDVGEFATKPHHTHACQACGFVWRPAIVHTVGVQFLPGFKDA